MRREEYLRLEQITLKDRVIDKIMLVIVTLLPLIAAVVIDYHFDRVAFPYRY